MVAKKRPKKTDTRIERGDRPCAVCGCTDNELSPRISWEEDGITVTRCVLLPVCAMLAARRTDD